MTSEKMKELLRQGWKEVFHVDEVTDETDFFEAGGDSIKAVQLPAWLIQKGVKLEMTDIFLNPSFGSLAEKLKESDPVYVPKELITKEIAAKEMGFASVEEGEMAEKGRISMPPKDSICDPNEEKQTSQKDQICTPTQGQNFMPVQGVFFMPVQGFFFVPIQGQVYQQMPWQNFMPMQNSICTPGQSQQNGSATDIPDQLKPYFPKTVDKAIENPNVMKINKAKIAEKTKSPEDALMTVMKGILPEFDKKKDFFDQGLTSLDTIKMVTRCGENGYELELKDIYLHPNFDELVRCLK